jgi:hypothetical protein
MVGERISNPTPGVGRKRGGRAKPDWSRNSGAKIPAFDSYDPKNMEDRPTPPERFTLSLSKFLNAEMAPVLETRGAPWRWRMHPGSNVLTLPFPRHWAFRRKGARNDAHPLTNHVIVGSWKIAPQPLGWWIASAQATADNRLLSERVALRCAGEDKSWVPRRFKIEILPAERNWMEPAGPDVHLLLVGCESAFPALGA